MDSPQRMTELIIWDTGEAELEFADINTGRATPQHHQIAEPNDVDDLLARQLAWLGYTTDSQPST